MTKWFLGLMVFTLGLCLMLVWGAGLINGEVLIRESNNGILIAELIVFGVITGLGLQQWVVNIKGGKHDQR